jgi:hypothetical protein
VIVAAHQPSYLPWLGYLDKLARADLFVVMDDLQYEAQNFQNRNRAKLNNGPGWLTVPLERGAQSDRICDKRIHNGGSPKEHWQRKTWTTLKHAYGKAPHFATYAADLEILYTRPWERLVDLDQHILELACRWLDIRTPIRRASELALEGQKTSRIIDLCRKVDARTYLSGRGGSTGYLDQDAFVAAGISLAWQDFEHPVYPQRYAELGFVPNLCFLDLLLNCGPTESRAVFHRTTEQKLAG